MVGPSCEAHYLVSSLAILSLENKDSQLFYFNCLLMSFDNWWPVSLPRGAMGWFTVCNCGVSESYYLLFHVILLSLIFKIPHCKHHLQGSAVS